MCLLPLVNCGDVSKVLWNARLPGLGSAKLRIIRYFNVILGQLYPGYGVVRFLLEQEKLSTRADGRNSSNSTLLICKQFPNALRWSVVIDIKREGIDTNHLMLAHSSMHLLGIWLLIVFLAIPLPTLCTNYVDLTEKEQVRPLVSQGRERRYRLTFLPEITLDTAVPYLSLQDFFADAVASTFPGVDGDLRQATARKWRAKLLRLKSRSAGHYRSQHDI